MKKKINSNIIFAIVFGTLAALVVVFCTLLKGTKTIVNEQDSSCVEETTTTNETTSSIEETTTTLSSVTDSVSESTTDTTTNVTTVKEKEEDTAVSERSTETSTTTTTSATTTTSTTTTTTTTVTECTNSVEETIINIETTTTTTTTTTTPNNGMTFVKTFSRGTYYTSANSETKGGSGRKLIDCSVGDGDVKGSVASSYLFKNYGYNYNDKRTKVYLEIKGYEQMNGYYYLDDSDAGNPNVIDFFYHYDCSCPFYKQGVVTVDCYIIE